VTIRASESVEINASGLVTTTFNRGNAGSIAIETGQLSVTDGALVSPSTLGAGNSGNLIVRAKDSVIVARARSDSPLNTALATNSVGTGRGGNIEINTGSLRVEAGASISASSGLIAGQRLIPTGGPGGNITVNAKDSVEVIGTSSGSIAFSSAIGAGTLGSGKGGDVTLNARRLILRDGGSILASTLGAGQAGNVTVTASESVEIVGTARQNIFSTLSTASGDVLLQTFFRLQSPSGAAGSLSIATGRLSVRDGALVGVQSLGPGAAGSINVVADSIALNTRATIDGRTVSGIGGNINLRARDIQLRDNSRITTDARAGEGGNITLNSDLLVGANNSDITAYARSAEGGRVNVNVPSILGFTAASREQVKNRLGLTEAQFAALRESPTSLLPSSDIAALSQSSAPALPTGVNPAQGLVELPQNIVAPAALIAANPCTKGTQSAFTVTGKGGLPLSPDDTLSSAASPWTWVEEPESSATDNVGEVTDRAQREIPAKKVVPARGWVVNARGEVMLVANEVAGQLDDRTRDPLSVCLPR
jgi:large exoprotein involved in heme utilization and adhesion